MDTGAHFLSDAELDGPDRRHRGSKAMTGVAASWLLARLRFSLMAFISAFFLLILVVISLLVIMNEPQRGPRRWSETRPAPLPWDPSRQDFTRIPRERCLFLREVAEPISFTGLDGIAESDKVVLTLTFEDSTGVSRSVTWVDYAPKKQKTLVLGMNVPPRSQDELAFLGMLQRWYLRDSEAWTFPEETSYRCDSLTPQQQAKYEATRLLRKFLGRNE